MMKQRTNHVALLAMVLLGLMLTACQSQVRVDSIQDNLPRIIDRHDMYVDQFLSGEDKATSLKDSNEVTSTLFNSSVRYVPKELHPVIVRVLNRHDEWVREDKNLLDIQREVYLDSSSSMRRLFAKE